MLEEVGAFPDESVNRPVGGTTASVPPRIRADAPLPRPSDRNGGTPVYHERGNWSRRRRPSKLVPPNASPRCRFDRRSTSYFDGFAASYLMQCLRPAEFRFPGHSNRPRLFGSPSIVIAVAVNNVNFSHGGGGAPPAGPGAAAVRCFELCHYEPWKLPG